MTNSAYELASPDVVSEKFQEGLVILNLASGQYFDVGGRTIALLDLVLSGINMNSVRDGMKKRDSSSLPELDIVIQKMLGYGILREIPATRHDVVTEDIAGIFAAGDEFYFECHDDLAELLAADPVHDVDPETGLIK